MSRSSPVRAAKRPPAPAGTVKRPNLRAATQAQPVAGPRDATPDPLLAELQIGSAERTLGANVTNALRKAIIRGQLPPGSALGQEYLARLFAVSRVPIRESLKQLASEGLVAVEPHRGAIVARLSLDELDELYGIIWALETLAVRVAVQRLNDADIAAMAAMIRELDAIDEPVEWYQRSVAFHRSILIASGWHRCVRIVDACRQNIGRYILDEKLFARHVGEWRERNRALFDACRRRDADAAVAALDVMRRLSTAQVRQHLEASLDGGQKQARVRKDGAPARRAAKGRKA